MEEVGPNVFNNVEKMFATMKPHFNAPLGNLCICMGSNYDNDIRKKFFQAGKAFGFTKIFITDWVSAMYNNLISNSNIKLQKGDLILIFCGQSCYIWFKGFKKAKFNKEMKYFDTVESLTQIRNSISKEPALIIYGTKYRTSLQNFKNVFGNGCKIHIYNYLNHVNGAVIKARIAGGDMDVIGYDSQALLDRDVTVSIGNKVIMEVKKWHPLPLFRESVDESVNGESVLKIASNFNIVQKQLPNASKISINLEIDTNGIYTITTYPIFNDPSQKYTHQNVPTFHHNQNVRNNYHYRIHQDFESSNDHDRDISNLISRQFRKHYFLPKRIQENDTQIFAVGIDLGTSRCCAAVNRRSGIETVPLDNLGERLLPSFVAFDEVEEKCGQIVINRLPHYPNSSVFDVKRIIGKRFEDVKIDKNWTFKILKMEDKIMIQTEDSNGTILKYPEEISAILLKNIKQKVEEFQGKPISKVIITVPAAFNSFQIKATYSAAKLAGWQQIKLLPEPIAAAFAYFINRPLPQASTLLIFDLGGGTLDVCIFKVIQDSIQIISRAGNSSLGGRDFDNLLIDYCKEKLIMEHGIVVPESKKYKLMLKCQEIKHNLTMISNEQLDIEEFDMSKEGYIKISRDQFESMSTILLDKISHALSSALSDQNIVPNQIDKILQVGGACRMPMIKNLLRKKFPEAGHCCEEHPEEVVAVGAAYYSYYLNLRQQQKNKYTVAGSENTKTDKQLNFKNCHFQRYQPSQNPQAFMGKPEGEFPQDPFHSK